MAEKLENGSLYPREKKREKSQLSSIIETSITEKYKGFGWENTRR